MRFDRIIPSERLQPYVKHFVIAETAHEHTYKVFPSTGLVIGFQYKGQLSILKPGENEILSTAGITGLTDRYKVFRNSADIGTILVFFTETGITHFSNTPAHELFNQSTSLEHIFDKAAIIETEEKLGGAATDSRRIKIVEQFLLSVLKEKAQDKLIMEAVKMIYAANGAVRIKTLNEKLFISQSPFEKRFRKLVGTTPKKFASVVRFNAVLNSIGTAKSLTDLCYENNFFDQAHFIKDFKQYTGESPDQFKRFL